MSEVQYTAILPTNEEYLLAILMERAKSRREKIGKEFEVLSVSRYQAYKVEFPEEWEDVEAEEWEKISEGKIRRLYIYYSIFDHPVVFDLLEQSQRHRDMGFDSVFIEAIELITREFALTFRRRRVQPRSLTQAQIQRLIDEEKELYKGMPPYQFRKMRNNPFCMELVSVDRLYKPIPKRYLKGGINPAARSYQVFKNLLKQKMSYNILIEGTSDASIHFIDSLDAKTHGFISGIKKVREKPGEIWVMDGFIRPFRLRREEGE